MPMKKLLFCLLGLLIGVGITAAGLVHAGTIGGTRVNQGGTGNITVSNGSILYGSSTNNSLVELPIGTIGKFLLSNGTIPTWVATSTLGLQPLITVTSPITLTGASVGIVNQGTTAQVLHGNAAGNASFGPIVNADITNGTIDLTSKVTGILPVINGGMGTTTLGDLTLTSSNLIFNAGDGKKVLIGTSTNITLVTNPAFTSLTVAGGQLQYGNASGTNESISNNFYLTTVTGTQCLHSVNGLVSGTGSDCGSGSGGSGNTTWLFGNRTLFNGSTAASTTNDTVGIGTTTPPTTSRLFVQASTSNTSLLTLASSTGSTVLNVSNALFPQVNIGTTTVQNVANLYVLGSTASSTADLVDIASSSGFTILQVKPANLSGGYGKVVINPQNPGVALPSAALEVDSTNGNNSDFVFQLVASGNGFPTVSVANASGTPLSVTNLTTVNAQLGSFDGYTWVPTSNWKKAASVSFFVDGTLSTSSAPTQIRFYTTATGTVTATQRMTINQAGNVGIGSSTPNFQLSVAGTVGFSGLTAFTTGDSAVCQRAGGQITVDSGVSSCIISSIYTKDVLGPRNWEDAQKDISQLNVLLFKYKDSGKTDIGLIAERVAEINPLYAQYTQIERDMDGHHYQIGDPVAINWSAITADLILVTQHKETPKTNYSYFGLLGLLGLIPFLKRKND